jgi:hypothetical protein
MSGRIIAKVIETGREAAINSPEKRPLEYIVTDKWDALAQDEMPNVDVGRSDERGIGILGKVEYSRALSLSDSGSLKMKPAMFLYDIGDESQSFLSSPALSYANSSVFSGPKTSVLCRLPRGRGKKEVGLTAGKGYRTYSTSERDGVESRLRFCLPPIMRFSRQLETYFTTTYWYMYYERRPGDKVTFTRTNESIRSMR